MKRYLLIILFALPVGMSSAAARAVDRAAGSQALPGGHRTLADLLAEADAEPQSTPPRNPAPPGSQPGRSPAELPQAEKPDVRVPEKGPDSRPVGDAGRPLAFQAPAPQRDINLSDLQRLIEERNHIVDGSRFFATMKEIVVEEKKLAAIKPQVDQAQLVLNRAAADAEALNAPGANQIAAAAKLAAQQRVIDAQAQLQRSVGAYRDQQHVLEPLYRRVVPAIAPWAKIYQQMTAFVAPRRSDRNRDAVLALLETATSRRADFCEGHVLAAICTAYDGRFEASRGHLDKAIAFIDEHQPALYPTHMTHDCAIAAMLAQSPDRVKGFVRMLKSRQRSQQSIAQQWLIAAYSVSTKAETTASDYFRRAIAQAGGFGPAGNAAARPLQAFLAGDAAHFWLTKKEVTDTDVKNATQVLDRAEASDAWQLARARAALAARQGRWEEASQRLEACRAECPAMLDAEVDEQREAYRQKQAWSRISSASPSTAPGRLMATSTPRE